MSKLLTAFHVGSTLGRTFSVSHSLEAPPGTINAISREAWDAGFRQGFIWYPTFVQFLPPGSFGSYWTEIHTSEKLELQSETSRAIAVPFTVPENNQIFVGGSDDVATAVHMSQGNYQLLFETQYVTADDASRIPGYDWYTPEVHENPQQSALELIWLTFIPTIELPEPCVLRSEPGFNPPQKLCLNFGINKAFEKF
jgi:hypothetical protein